jgi:hypothetical protein
VGRFVTTFLQMPEAAKQQVDEALTMWAAEKDRIAEGGESATSLGTCGNILPTEAADMASELVKGISEYYLCRNIDEQWSQDVANKQWSSKKHYCGFFSVARNWMATDVEFKQGHYRCPLCGVLYQPWIWRPGKFVDANKLLVIEADEQSVAKMQELLGAPAGSVAAGHLAEGTGPAGSRLVYIPFQWAQSAEQSLMQRFKEIFLKVGNDLAGLPLSELPLRIAELDMESQVQKSWWQQMSLTEKAVEQAEKVNSSSSKERYHFEHLASGFIGSTFACTPDVEVWNQDRLATVWGTVRIAVREAMRARPATP